jgi:hypothetical protein
MAYFVLTILESSAGSRKKAAKSTKLKKLFLIKLERLAPLKGIG